MKTSGLSRTAASGSMKILQAAASPREALPEGHGDWKTSSRASQQEVNGK